MTENEVIKKSIEVFEKPSKHIKCVYKCENGMEFLTYSQDLVLAFETAIDCLEEIQQYRAIGTVEECREARERQREKEPTLYGDFEDGKLLCPNCEEDLMDLVECGFNCCPYCGKSIDWSE